MFRTGPIRNFTSSEVTVVASVLAAEAPIPVRHDVRFSVVGLDQRPVVLHADRASVVSGHMVTFEAPLAATVRNWEVRVEADPDLVLITIHHLVDGRPAPAMTYHTGELYYVDLLDEFDEEIREEDDDDRAEGLFVDLDNDLGDDEPWR